MNVSLNGLKLFIDLPESPEQIAELLTSTGLECEGIDTYEQIKGGLNGLIIGQVVTCSKHPDADKLSITTVDIGQPEHLNIVCGAPNVAAGQKVIVATVGTTLYPASGEPFTIKKAKIRGQESMGMICAEDEIGLGNSHEGIMVLPNDTPIGLSAAKLFNVEADSIFAIGLTPNRGDAASHYGVARDLKAKLQRPIKSEPFAKASIGNAACPIAVTIQQTNSCLRYAGLVIEGITVADSPDWLKNSLKAIGLNPINNIVDATNYVLHYFGQPLHAFDADEILGQKIIVKNANIGQKFTTLDGIERTLKGHELTISNAQEPMVLAGVFGGLNSGVKASTKRIFIESACFAPDAVRLTSVTHQLKTDSSFRFERGTDPNFVVDALLIVANIIIEVAGGSIPNSLIDVYPNPIKNQEIKTNFRYFEDILGISIPESTIKKILTDLDFEIKEEKNEKGAITVRVPSYRTEVTRPADLAEELIRIYGLDKLPLNPHYASEHTATFAYPDPDALIRKVTLGFSANGFFEAMNLSLTSSVQLLSINENSDEVIKLLSKNSEELDCLRTTLLPGMLNTLAYNINRQNRDLRFYELGRVYSQKNGNYSEKQMLGIALSGKWPANDWRKNNDEVNAHSITNAVALVFASLGLPNPRFEKKSATQATVLSNKGIAIGTVLQPSDKILKTYGLKQKVWFAELDLAVLLNLVDVKIKFTELPRMPGVFRDLSMVLDQKITFEQIENLAYRTERSLLKKVLAFDVYQGKNIGESKKSYAISFFLQDPEKTLNEKQVEKSMEKLMQAFETELGAQIRKQ